ncbi:MAG: hypothetical protein QE271_11530 [Bacteriovoracaceae bacterium]|nr:hypothetical protein [Bacteriovoracaceae bacterium]
MKHLNFPSNIKMWAMLLLLFSWACSKGGKVSDSGRSLSGSLETQNTNPFKELSIEFSQDNGVPSIASTNVKKTKGDFKFLSSKNRLKTVEAKIVATLKPEFANLPLSFKTKIVDLTNNVNGSPISTEEGEDFSLTVVNPTLIGLTTTVTDNSTGAKLSLESNLIIQCETAIVGDPFEFDVNGLVLTPASETLGNYSLGGYFADFSGVIKYAQLGLSEVKVGSFDKDGSWIRNSNPPLSMPWRDRFRTPTLLSNGPIPFYTMFGSSKQKMGVTLLDKCNNSQDVLLNIPAPHFTTQKNSGVLHSVSTELEAYNEAAWNLNNNAQPDIIDFLTVHDTQLNTSVPSTIVDDALSGYRQFISRGITPYVARNITSELIYSGSSIKVTFREEGLSMVKESEGNYSYVVDIAGISLPTNLNQVKNFYGLPVSIYSNIPGLGDGFAKTSFSGNANNANISIKLVRLVTGDCSGGQTPPPGSLPYQTKSKTFLVHAVWGANLIEVGATPARSISSMNGKYYKLLGTEEAYCPGVSGGGPSPGGGPGANSD